MNYIGKSYLQLHKEEKWDNLISAIMQKYIMKTGLIAGKPHNTQLLTYSRNIYKGEG